MLASLVEVLDMVAFQRLDFRLDERVQLREHLGDLTGQLEVHGGAPFLIFFCSS
jgi:hypothetical protein